MDSNIWGLLAVPVGLLLCFGPAIFVWIIAESKGSSEEDRGATEPRPK